MYTRYYTFILQPLLKEAIIFEPKVAQKRLATEKPFLTGKYTFHFPLYHFKGAKVDFGSNLTLGQSNKR